MSKIIEIGEGEFDLSHLTVKDLLDPDVIEKIDEISHHRSGQRHYRYIERLSKPKPLADNFVSHETNVDSN